MPTLIIMRHAEAVALKTTDANRTLTENGKQVCTKAASDIYRSYLSQKNSLCIYHSPYLRTTQTAELVAKQLTSQKAINVSTLANDVLLEASSPAKVATWLSTLDLNNNGIVMLISHQPLVSKLIEWLVNGENSLSLSNEFSMSPASVAVLDFEFAAQACATLLSLKHFS